MITKPQEVSIVDESVDLSHPRSCNPEPCGLDGQILIKGKVPLVENGLGASPSPNRLEVANVVNMGMSAQDVSDPKSMSLDQR